MPFPPRSTACNIFHQFQRDGVREQVWAERHMALREGCGCKASPTACIIDGQALKAAEKGAAKPGMKTTHWPTAPAGR